MPDDREVWNSTTWSWCICVHPRASARRTNGRTDAACPTKEKFGPAYVVAAATWCIMVPPCEPLSPRLRNAPPPSLDICSRDLTSGWRALCSRLALERTSPRKRLEVGRPTRLPPSTRLTQSVRSVAVGAPGPGLFLGLSPSTCQLSASGGHAGAPYLLGAGNRQAGRQPACLQWAHVPEFQKCNDRREGRVRGSHGAGIGLLIQ